MLHRTDLSAKLKTRNKQRYITHKAGRIGLSKPSEERLSSLADLLGSRDVGVLLAGLRSPLGYDVLADEIVVVVELEDLDNRLEHLGILGCQSADETLGSSEKSLLMTLRILTTYLLEHAGTLGDLGNNVLVKHGLNKDKDAAVLVFNTKLLGLDIDIDRLNLVDATLLLRLGLDPITKLVVDSRATLTILIIVVAHVELLLELARKGGLTGLNSFLAHVDSPFMLLDFFLLGGFSSLSLDLLELVVADILVPVLVRAILGSFIATSAVLAISAISSIAILLSLLGGPAFSLILLALLGLVLEDKATELQAEDMVILDDNIGLRILALLAENELVDEAIKMVLELGSIVSTVDDPTVVLGVNVGLSTKLETEVLDDICTRTGERGSNTAQVDDDGLDTVSFTFDLGLQTLHLVTIESIADIATNVDESHGDGIE
ncbi:hypothetical protein HG530_014118 [Fusarium avenaceum]|nr:hypothetical protein HG530_014118 [Fusarium avenaceum]